MSLWPILDKMDKWEVGYGHIIRVWGYCWVEAGIRIKDHMNVLPDNEDNEILASIITNE